MAAGAIGLRGPGAGGRSRRKVLIVDYDIRMSSADPGALSSITAGTAENGWMARGPGGKTMPSLVLMDIMMEMTVTTAASDAAVRRLPIISPHREVGRRAPEEHRKGAPNHQSSTPIISPGERDVG